MYLLGLILGAHIFICVLSIASKVHSRSEMFFYADDGVSNSSGRGKKINSDLFVEKTSATSLIAILQKSIDLPNLSPMSLNVISQVEKY
jgi:hypothetical protein